MVGQVRAVVVQHSCATDAAAKGSGKSTFAKTKLPSYEWINRDVLITPAKCLAATSAALDAKKSVVIDNTNPRCSWCCPLCRSRRLRCCSKAKRAEYIRLAQQRNVPVRCMSMKVTRELAEHLNIFREVSFLFAVEMFCVKPTFWQRLTNGASPHVPKIGYNMFKSQLQEPSMDEGEENEAEKKSFIFSRSLGAGFEDIVMVPFQGHFQSAAEKELFLKWS